MNRVLHLGNAEGEPGKVYFPLQLKWADRPEPDEFEVLVNLKAAALNHRDLFVRHRQYPGISLDHPMLADGCGTVVKVGSRVSNKSLLGQAVLLTPMRGWVSDPAGPEEPSKWTITGSSRSTPIGTGQDFVCVPEHEVVMAPDHLTAPEGAALPLVGLTAWRALTTKAEAAAGQNILVTGIGGGVALMLLQFGLALGVNMFVSSGDEAKLMEAERLGAKGGVIYKKQKWEADLRAKLPADRPFLDAIIDGAGGEIISKAVKLLKPGGKVVQYGMTVSPTMPWNMAAVLLNVELRGTTMGSRKEFGEMVAFVSEKKIRPVISRVVDGLDNLESIDGLFAEMEAGKQMGKLVISIDEGSSSKI